jgi:hypothetical protein
MDCAKPAPRAFNPPKSSLWRLCKRSLNVKLIRRVLLWSNSSKWIVLSILALSLFFSCLYLQGTLVVKLTKLVPGFSMLLRWRHKWGWQHSSASVLDAKGPFASRRKAKVNKLPIPIWLVRRRGYSGFERRMKMIGVVWSCLEQLDRSSVPIDWYFACF